ncbi:hypothetical protein P7K49_028562 [Saguinus oedipus]|uniref:Uncharacterized protein n=1 Tax=Saguinus oedipus TaxID=9490 RepID=A0ABQ9U5I1_SAGOE|nr:hypothetical protein P7K49_028562 [Saguinus oedipus]
MNRTEIGLWGDAAPVPVETAPSLESLDPGSSSSTSTLSGLSSAPASSSVIDVDNGLVAQVEAQLSREMQMAWMMGYQSRLQTTQTVAQIPTAAGSATQAATSRPTSSCSDIPFPRPKKCSGQARCSHGSVDSWCMR